MKIAIVSRHDPEDVSAWSGTPYFITREIKKISGDVVIVRAQKTAWLLMLTKAFRYLFRKLGFSIDLSVTGAFSKAVSKEIQRKIDLTDPEVIVGIAASPELAHIRTDVPIFHISDATYAIMTDYYPEHSRIPNWLWREGNEIEREVIGKSFYSIFPSRWAMNSAQKDYDANLEKLKFIRLGANVGSLPIISDAYLEKKFGGKCNILFMGKDWERKGGDIILSAFKHIRDAGIEAQLTIVGCDPFSARPPEGVQVYENLKKSDPEQFALYNKLFSEASLFVLPTRAEAYGLVFAEAAAFATPSVAPTTGGVPSVVDDGKSGVLLPSSADGKDYADAIIKLWQDKTKLAEMAVYAHEKYVNELNWDKWRNDFSVLLSNLQKADPLKEESIGGS